MTASAPRAWSIGSTLLMIPPFIGLAIILLDLPRWLEAVGVAAIIGLVYLGSRLLYRKQGGWQPSKTLPEQRSENDH